MPDNEQNQYPEDFASMKIAGSESAHDVDSDSDDLDLMLEGFTMEEIDQDSLDYDANNEAPDIDDDTKEKIRMAMASEELDSGTKDKELIYMAAAQRIALRRGIPRVPSIFGSPKKCEEFVKQSLADFPPPTYGMLETAKKVFEVGDMVGLAISSMEKYRKYLLTKSTNESPSDSLLDRAFELADDNGVVVPPRLMDSAEGLEEWVKQYEGE